MTDRDAIKHAGSRASAFHEITKANGPHEEEEDRNDKTEQDSHGGKF
jgi:hypothetical protein